MKIKKMILVAMSAVAIIAGTFQSCNSDFDATQGLIKQPDESIIKFVLLSEVQKNKIKKSNELEEYIEANVELYSSILKVDSIMKSSKSTEDYIISKNGENLKKKNVILKNSLL